MRKITLFLIATFFSALSFAALNPYAYGLSSELSLDEATLTVKYSLNADATGVNIVILNGETVVETISCDGKTKGNYTVEIPTASFPKSTSLTWQVEVLGNSVATPTKQTTTFSFYLPYSMDVDVDTESDYFGRWYVIEATNGGKGKSGYHSTSIGRGLYAFDAALEPIKNNNSGTYGFTGGMTLGANTTNAAGDYINLACVTTSGGRVFVGRYEPGLAPILEATDLHSNDYPLVLRSGGGRAIALDARGRGENLQLVMLDTDFNIKEYDLGTAEEWTTAATPSRTFNKTGLIIDRNDAAITYDNEGGLWINQHSASNPTIAHLSTSGLDYDNITAGLSHILGEAKYNIRGAAINQEGTELAVPAAGRGKVAVFTISKDSEGKISLTPKYTVTTGNNNTALSYDYADNLYIANRSAETISFYAMPYDGEVTTPAPSKYAFELTEVVPEVYTLTTNVVGEGTIEGNAGSYVEGTTATLTASPADHYDFVNWTYGSETSTDNPLTITVNSDMTVTANFAKKQYILTVFANDDTKGDVTTGGTYDYGTAVQITATPKPGYEFAGWSNGSKDNPLTITIEEDIELTANFRAVLASSITLNAHPVKDYSASIAGTMKRAIQNGENTIVLTHEVNGTPHIYSIEHSTKTVTEISQEGVHAAADGFLSISDIAVTEDGKLVACNYVHCTFTPSNTSYFYIWNDLEAAPSVWFTSQKSGNYNDAYMGYTMALKGTSQNAEVTISAFNKSNSNTRYSHLYVVDGTYSDASYKYSRDNAALHPNTLGKNTYELNASPLAAGKWIVDGELASPIEFVEKNAVAIDTYTPLNTNVLGKKYNGASYLFHKDHHLMIAPYAADDKLAGVKVMGITDGFGSAVEVETATTLQNAIDATAAAATAYVDGDGDLTIYLFADSKVYTFSEKEYTAPTYIVTATAGEGGSVEGGGTYEEGATATVTATANEHYDFVNWTEDGEVVSTTAEYSFTVTKDIELTANFQEHTKYTITASAADNTMGYVTGDGTYYAGETVTLKAVANSTYCFVNWSDGNTDATRTFTATADVTLTANFAKASPRAWAYDLKMVEDGDNYKFSFNATTAANATLLFLDKEGNELYTAHEVGAVAAGANTISIEKAYFTQVKDVYWAVKMDGEAISHVAEITDQTRGIYDFYNMMGVLVDNDPNSNEFGKIYIQASINGASDGATARSDAQKAGLFIYDQGLNELNPTSNVGIAPTVPSGYEWGAAFQFHRLAVDPKTSNLVYSYAIASKPAVFSMDRANLTGTPTNLIAGIDGFTRIVAHCFDAEGTLYVMDLASSKGTIYKIKDGVKTVFVPATDKFVNSYMSMTSDGRGGLWVSHNRGQLDTYYQLAHVASNGTIDWYVDQTSTHGFTGSATRASLAYDAERHILAQGRNSTVEVFQVAYDATTGVPTLTKIATTPQVNKANIDGLAFDYAGDLYVVNSGTEKFYKYTLPTAENICTVPAPESQAIIKEVRYTVTVNTVGNGTATGAGEYVVGETAILKATPAANHKFVNWTYDSETSTDNPLELVVNSDITVTANFAPVQYTLIAPTNDEDKGTVTGAGTYNYGTEVTLTANPAAGYKLLYWSDRSTENPRTITMTKNEAISAYFVKEYAEEPTFKIEKMWENTNVPASTTNGYQAVGWDGKIYMQNKTAGKIITYSSAEDTGTEYATSGLGQQIAVDEAGNLIVFNATFSTANPNAILIYQKGSTEGKAVSFTLKDPAACHFFSASGDIYSAEGGYVYFYCNGKQAVYRLKITNGAATAADVTTDIVGGSIYAGGTQNHVMVDIFGNLVAHARSNAVNVINVHTNESKTFSLPSIKMGTLGGCSFELGGKELWAYHAGATNYSSEWNIYNMTDGVFLSDDDFYAVDKNGTTNYACNWLNVQVVDEYTAYIYQFCPLKAAAVWKVSIQRDDLQEYTVTATANDASMGSVTGGGTYYEGATAILTATANSGYRFVNWTKDETILSTDASFTYTVPAENVTIVANFEALPTITYELNGGVWNKYGWTSKKDMYDAFIADWKAYSGSTRATKTYEEQYGIGKSNGGIPTTIQGTEDILGFMSQEKWAWLGQFLDAIATAQGTKLPSEATVQMRFALGNFFGEDNNKVGDSYVDAVDCSGDNASLSEFAPYWGQTFPMPMQPTEEVILNAPYKEGYLFDGWYATSNFSGSEVTAVDPNTDGTLYAKWIEHKYTRDVTNGHYGTVCLPYGSSDYTGAEFYEIAYLEMDGENPKTLWLDEVDGALEAGKPYIFKATSDMLVVLYEGEEVSSPILGNAGLTGTFGKIEDGNVGDAQNILEGNYLIVQQQFWLCLGNCSLAENRAYIDHDKLHANTKPISPIPGRRRVGMGSAQENTTTGVSNITEGSTIDPVKRGIYDVMGRKLDQPTTTGFYIIDGKKVFIVK